MLSPNIGDKGGMCLSSQLLSPPLEAPTRGAGQEKERKGTGKGNWEDWKGIKHLL